MLVSEWLHELLESDAVADVERIARLEAQLSHFVEGGVVDPSYMQRLRRPAHAVFEIRSRRPRPSIRVFGRFAERDVFIAVNAALRDPLGGMGSRPWRDEVVRTQTLWRQLFPTYDALDGRSLHELISENAYDRHELG